MVSRTQAIGNFLRVCGAPADLTSLYTPEMECQVYVKKGNNQTVPGLEFRGKKYTAYQCGETGVIYKPFRIPWDSMTENAHYEDTEMGFDLAKYADGIGLTGWNWAQKKSVWVGYDFDSIANHTKGLTKEDLDKIYKAVYDLPYVTIRTSTTGSGYHIYVFVDGVDAKSHTEHQSLARAILTKMSLDSGMDLRSKVDQLGQILWLWASKYKEGGLALIKQGEVLKDIPLNWREHVGVVGKRISKLRPELISEEEIDNFNEMAKRRIQTPLDDKHRRVIDELNKVEGYDSYWNSDYGMLITHTLALKEVHKKLSLIGPFETATTGSSTKNCFAFPLDDGAWVVRRHGRGVAETTTWTSDRDDWTLCYYNRLPDFGMACKMHDGVEDTDGSYVFSSAENAVKAARELNVDISIGPDMVNRSAKLKVHNRTDKLIVEIDAHNNDPVIPGWIKKNKVHQYISRNEIKDVSLNETESSEEEFRHCVTPEGEDAGFFIKGINNMWIEEPRLNVLSALSSIGYSQKEREMEIGRLIKNYWIIVSEPFQPEYLGNRQWNRGAAQLRYTRKEDASNLHYPTWSSVLNHLGNGLTPAVLKNPWCIEHGLQSGGDYLKCWIASIIQYPKQPLPYLFFYGKENTGKSSFHEAIELLFTTGVVRVAAALQSSSHFNGELRGAVLGIIEELNMSDKRNGSVVNKIKDWVTSRRISIHVKGETPFMSDNTMHFAQFSNNLESVPVFSGDTRIVVIHVEPLKNEIPKDELIRRLEDEAQDFTTELMDLEIPKANGRLRIPTIETEAKELVANTNVTDIEEFVASSLFHRNGTCVSVQDVWDAYCSQYDVSRLTPAMLIKNIALITSCPRGKYGHAKTMHWANLTLSPEEPESDPYVIVNGYLKKGI